MVLERQDEAKLGSSTRKNVANTVWAYVARGRKPGEGMLEGQAEAISGELMPQDVAKTVWANAKWGASRGIG